MNRVSAAIRLVLVCFSLVPGFQVFSNGEIEADDLSENDLLNIVGPDECGECHKAEVHIWRETMHAKTFHLLTRKKQTKEIAGNMGIKRVKRAEACMSCHFTSGYRKNKVKAIAGISCESCHGPAKDWLKVHGDYGGKNVTREQETPRHKAKRVAAIKDSGMIRPKDLYRLASNCYQCHIVSNEKLINVGRHGPGSDDFELLSWSLGEIRHKFLRSEGKKNDEASPERKRMLYVVGKSLDLEYGLRALVESTENGTYRTGMMKRVERVVDELRTIDALIAVPEVRTILKIIEDLDLKLYNKEAGLVAADEIAVTIQTLAGTRDGSQWSALDRIIPQAERYKGKPGGPPEQLTMHDLPALVGRLNR